jgi:hypothetical protein
MHPSIPAGSAAAALSPAQQSVLELLSSGSTLTAAAASAGIHRNTVVYWRRTSPIFREALTRAIQQKTRFWREQADSLIADAIEAIRGILHDPAAPAGVRVTAALKILDIVTTPPPEIETLHNSAQDAQPPAPPKAVMLSSITLPSPPLPPRPVVMSSSSSLPSSPPAPNSVVMSSFVVNFSMPVEKHHCLASP